MERQSKSWNIAPIVNQKSLNDLQQALNVDRIIASLLIQRGVHTFDEAKIFFRPELDHLHDPFLMKDMDRAVKRIQAALLLNEKILIYGDYDVDGTTAVALFYSFISSQTTNVDFYIPDRYKEGYGISYTGIDYAVSTGCSLIVALDCGIKSVDHVRYAKEKGVDFVICDHHLPSDILPEAVAILDPKQSDCHYPYKELSGCAIGFKLAHAICKENQMNFSEVEKYLDLVAISIAADIVPITGENRILAYFGLKKLNQKERPGILALLENLKQDGQKSEQEITISNIVFTIGPRINAAGRIDHGSKAVRLLTSRNFDEAKKIAEEINKNNSDRRDLDLGITNEALEMISKEPESKNRKTNVLFRDTWHKGVVGIVASRITEHYYKPTVVLTESNGMVMGSARSVKDFDLYNAIEKCSDLLEQFGGHKYAAGLAMRRENFDAFSKKFEKVVSDSITDEMLIPREEIDLQINFNEIKDKLFRVLKQFAPHGPGNMTPVFCTNSVYDTGFARVVGSNHLKLELHQEQNYHDRIEAIGFGMGDYLPFFQQKREISICYTINQNHYGGKDKLQLVIRSIKVD